MSLCKFVKSIFFGIICEKSYYLGCYYDCKYQIWFEKTLFNSELLHPPFFYLLNFGRCRNWRMRPSFCALWESIFSIILSNQCTLFITNLPQILPQIDQWEWAADVRITKSYLPLIGNALSAILDAALWW